MPLPVGVDLPDDLPVDLPIWALTVEISSHHSWPLDVSTSGSWSANMSSNSRNLKLPFLTTRCLYWGDRSAVNLPICTLTVEISSHHSWPLDASTSGSWSANINSNSRNLKSPFLTTGCIYWGVNLPVDQPIWAPRVEISSHHSWPLDASTVGVDMPVDLPIWALTVEISNWHPLLPDASTGEVDLPVNLPIWALTVEISSHHSWPLDALAGWVDLPVDLPIWALTVEIWSHHSWPLDASTEGEICQLIGQYEF